MYVYLEVLQAGVKLEHRNPSLRDQLLTLETREGTVQIDTDIDTLIALRDEIDYLLEKRQAAASRSATA